MLLMCFLHTVFAQSISGPTSLFNQQAGNDVMFTVVATGDSPLYFWQRNGASISNGMKYSGVNTAELTVTSIVEADEGFYSCIVIISGQVLSSSAELTVCKLTYSSYIFLLHFTHLYDDVATSVITLRFLLSVRPSVCV